MSIFSRKSASPYEACLFAVSEAVGLLLERRQISKSSKFEVMLFGSHYLLNKFGGNRRCYYNLFKKGYFTELYSFANKEGIVRDLPCSFIDFCNSRLEFYKNEMQLLADSADRSYIPIKMTYNFYERPLRIEGGQCTNLELNLIFLAKLKYFFEALDKCLTAVIKEFFFDNTPFDLYLSGAMKKYDVSKESGIAELSKAIQLCPTFELPYFERAKFLVEKGDYLKAIEDFSKVIELSSAKNDEIYELRGEAYEKNGDFGSALSDFNTHIQLNPFSLSTHINIGDIKLKQLDYEGAIASYTLRIHDYEESFDDEEQTAYIDFEVYFKRGKAFLGSKRYHDAIKDFDVALSDKYTYNRSKILYYRAIAKNYINDCRGSLIDFSTVIEENPKLPLPYFKRALVKIRIGLKASAYDDLKVAESLGQPKVKEIIDKYFK